MGREVEKAIKTLKKDRVPGPDKISNVFQIKHKDILTPVLTHILTMSWKVKQSLNNGHLRTSYCCTRRATKVILTISCQLVWYWWKTGFRSGYIYRPYPCCKTSLWKVQRIELTILLLFCGLLQGFWLTWTYKNMEVIKETMCIGEVYK